MISLLNTFMNYHLIFKSIFISCKCLINKFIQRIVAYLKNDNCSFKIKTRKTFLIFTYRFLHWQNTTFWQNVEISIEESESVYLWIRTQKFRIDIKIFHALIVMSQFVLLWKPFLGAFKWSLESSERLFKVQVALNWKTVHLLPKNCNSNIGRV